MLSGLVTIVAGVGILVGDGRLELWQGIYFALLTTLSIGYGDLAPLNEYEWDFNLEWRP